VTVLGCGAIGRGLGHEGGALLSRLSALTKDAPESCLASFTRDEIGEKELLGIQKRVYVSQLSVTVVKYPRYTTERRKDIFGSRLQSFQVHSHLTGCFGPVAMQSIAEASTW
jgi:hypothetical protein